MLGLPLSLQLASLNSASASTCTRIPPPAPRGHTMYGLKTAGTDWKPGLRSSRFVRARFGAPSFSLDRRLKISPHDRSQDSCSSLTAAPNCTELMSHGRCPPRSKRLPSPCPTRLYRGATLYQSTLLRRVVNPAVRARNRPLAKLHLGRWAWVGKPGPRPGVTMKSRGYGMRLYSQGCHSARRVPM